MAFDFSELAETPVNVRSTAAERRLRKALRQLRFKREERFRLANRLRQTWTDEEFAQEDIRLQAEIAEFIARRDAARDAAHCGEDGTKAA